MRLALVAYRGVALRKGDQGSSVAGAEWETSEVERPGRNLALILPSPCKRGGFSWSFLTLIEKVVLTTEFLLAKIFVL